MHKQIEDVRESGILPWTVSCAVVNCFPAAGLWGPDFQGRIRRAFGHDAPAGWRSGELDQSTSCAKQAQFTRLREMSESYDDLLKTGTLCNLKQEHSKTIHCLFLPLKSMFTGLWWIHSPTKLSHTPVSYLVPAFQVILDWSRARNFSWILIYGAWTQRLRAKTKNDTLTHLAECN